ncbi:uncharacterized protein E0L32_004755 [Thyridium curvatum]|uniref:Protein transport protein SEC31 n=1 Tax=Thyridium curvatum TaxID=1093900 RepID=A0A507B604_9PEZI|nr:uncharacterized protein E0L32_004755 [Thyridium curvatum]TPX15197.1 hypothetical protein E0L32_004755 [Thyridium curvatum]
MVRLREIPRTAAFAWSPGADKPLLVTGTRAGAVDADFSDETKLELWDLNLDSQDQGLELQPIASITTDSRFYDIAWGLPNDDHPRGIIAGALENGSLDLWDAEKLATGAPDALIARTTKHSGAIKSLQFNPLKPQILATAGAKGELFIWDVNDPSSPFRLGTSAARSDDLECVAWNRKVPNILATGGSGGFVTVWDLKTKKASLTLNNSRKAVSSIAWDPQNSTKLLTATPDDSTPFILIWNLRNSNAPERTLQGHEQGVLSVSWCQQDSDLLISSGKDNRTLVWNPQTGEQYGEFPEVTNWTFLTRFNPHNPNLSATASFDGKITIQTLQNTNPSASQAAVQNNLDGEDFFTKAQTQPQGASFTLTKAPAWFERPVGASFGFGGKVVIFRKDQSSPGQKRSSKIQISHFSVDSDIGSTTDKFEETLRTGDLKSICEDRLEHARTDEEKGDWQVMSTLIAENPRQQVIEFLGLAQDADEKELADADTAETEGGESAAAGDDATSAAKKNRLSNFFADGGDGDDFLGDLAATKGAKTDNPFHLLNEGNTHLEDSITRALMLGNFSKAVDICLKEDRIADAFIIANCGGKELVDKVQAAYLSSKKGSPSYLRLLSSVIAENLWDVVYNAGLADWKETMATLCTFAKPAEFPDLCEALGDRILESGSRKDASFCYLVGSKLEKVVSIWIDELEETEQAGLKESSEGSSFSIHAKSLQQFIEKVTIFRLVTKFQDAEISQSSDWKLANLYDKYTEYADIVAAHGQLAVAQKYLDLLPSKYPAAEVARNRVRLASQKGAAQQAGRPAAATRTTSRVQPTVGYQPPQAAPAMNPAHPYGTSVQPPAPNPYGPPQPTAYPPPSATAFGQPTQGYAPSQAYAPPQPTGYTPPASYGQPAPPFGAPPRNSTPSSLPPPPKIKKDVGQWNDVPMVNKPPVRKTTPSVAAITSPFGAQQNAAMSPPPTAPPTGPYGGQRSVASPPPPPPKGSAPPRVSSPLAAGPHHTSQVPVRPPSTAANAYAPPPPAPGATPAHVPHAMPPRTASPYNQPPGAAPPSNRYAPSPAMQQQSQFSQPPQQYAVAPPPAGAGRPPPTNPYAPAAPQQQASPSPYAPSPYGAGPGQTGPPPTGPPPMSGPPMGGPPTGPPPSSHTGPPPANTVATPPPPKAAAPPPKARHPAGDRSHIPVSAQRLVDILTRDMQRVSSKAPAAFETQVKDTAKRLNILFDHLNNEELVKPDTIGQLTQLAEALEAKQYDVAHSLQVEIHREKPEQCGNWMVGVKRLISMSKATPALVGLSDQKLGTIMTEGVASEDAAAARAAEQARLRKERREAKIKAGGTARLNKITGLGGGVQRDAQPAASTASSAPPPSSSPAAGRGPSEDHADPAEVDISEHYYQPSSTTARIPPAAAGGPPGMSEAQLRQMMLGFEQPPPGLAGPGPAAAGQNPFGAAGADEDPMMKLLSQMMMGGPGAGAGGVPPGMGGAGAANPFFPGMPMPGQQAQVPDRYASLWRLVHFAVALGLGLYIALATPFTGSRAEREQSALEHRLGHVTEQDVARQYFFWAFATAESVLLTSRFFLDRGRNKAGAAGGSILWSLLGFLPPPVKTSLETGMQYVQIFSTVRADILACIFVLGVCHWVRAM